MKYEEVCKDKLQIERELKKSKDTEQKWYDDAEDLRAKNDELNLQDVGGLNVVSLLSC